MRNSMMMALLILSGWSLLGSCKKDETKVPDPWPPQPMVATERLVVGSGVDSVPLNSSAMSISPDIDINFARDWQSQWTCIQKPSGAPDPYIYGDNLTDGMAVGLKEGVYQFEITYSTRAGSKKAKMEVNVVPDKPAGTIVVLDDLEWTVSASGRLGDTVPPYAEVERTDSPDLFFYRGPNRQPVVEFLDPKSNQWVKASVNPTDLQSISHSLLRFNDRGSVYLDYNSSSMSLLLYKDITADWLSGTVKSPPVRLTY